MLLILPLAHESQRVQRLPWVTFTFIAINFLVFLYTNFSVGIDENLLGEKLDNFYTYLSEHPYLHVPSEMDEFLTDEDREQLEALKESYPTGDMLRLTIESEQEELDAIAEEITGMLNESPFNKYGYIPKEPSFINLFTCMFVHAGWLHLIGNMLFLYLAGCSIEDLWGRPLYIGFYFLSGILATWMHAVRFPESTAPLVGASGAIAGLMGAFAIRLYKTRIHFFYLIWVRWGTFQAPAFIMLPLWFLQQLWYASLAGESEVAFHAHIGGFIFGALIAVGMKYSGIEEKYLAPAIEKKVSLAQNPLFLHAMELSEKSDFTGALLLLEKVVRQEPNHLDAFMEMRRIADISMDESAYTRYAAGILDALIRTREAELLRTTYEQYLRRDKHVPLPAKTLFGLAGFFEEEQESASALRIYEELVSQYPEDPFAMKGWSKMSRIYFDKQNDQEKGKQALANAYGHSQASDQWKTALQTDMRKHGLPISEPVRHVPTALTVPAAAASAVAAAVAPARPAGPAPRSAVQVNPNARPAAATDVLPLPNPDFDGDTAQQEVTIVPCRVQKIVINGILLNNEDQVSGLLPYKAIGYVSSGRIHTMDAAAARLDKDYLVLDLVMVASQNPKRWIIYRIQGQQVPFSKLFPLLEQTFLEAFQNFAGIIVNSSGAVCLPDPDRCLGPVFAQYANPTRYDNQLREKLL